MFPPLTPIVKLLLILNIGVFAAGKLLGIDFASFLGLYSILSPMFNPLQLITHMFLHDGIMHLLSNMFGLFMFGPMIESALGEKRFIQFYLICGLGAAALYSGISYMEGASIKNAAETYLASPTPDQFVIFLREHAPANYSQNISFIKSFSYDPDNETYISETKKFVLDKLNDAIRMPMVGASGAIFGILMAFGMLFPNMMLMILFIPVPIKAKYLIGFYALYEIIQGILRTAGDNVAHFAHIGGMLFAFILFKIWRIQGNRY